jgi:hypothetical protein
VLKRVHELVLNKINLTSEYCCWSGPPKSEVWLRGFRIWRIILKVLVFTHDIVFATSVLTEIHHMLQVQEESIEKCGLQVSHAKWAAFQIDCRNKTLTDTGPSLLCKETEFHFFSLDNLPYLGMNWDPWNKRSKFDTDYKPISVVCNCLCLLSKP